MRKYRCGACNANVPDVVLRATDARPWGVGECPKCGAVVARKISNRPLMAILFCAFFGLWLAKDNFSAGPAVNVLVQGAMACLLVVALLVVHKGQKLMVVR